MADPTNASDPDSTDDELDEEYIDTGFDALHFWDTNRQIILIVGGVILLALIGFGIYQINQAHYLAAAGAALSQAASEDDYRAVIDKYPGTVAAGNAAIRLAGMLRAEKKYDNAIQVLQGFLDKYPAHPLASGADLSIAEILEAQGKPDDAMSRYQEVAAKYPDSYSAPVAVLDQANLLEFQGKTDDARRVFENFAAQFPDSVFAQQAMTEMRLMRPAPGAASSSPSPAANPENPALPSFLNPAGAAPPPAAPAPAPTAAASPAPGAPAH